MTTTASATATAPTIHVAIAAVAEQVGAVGKHGKMEAGPARYNYRSLDDLINAVHGPLVANGVTITPHNVQVISEIQGATQRGGTTHLLRAIVTYRAYGPLGDHIEATVFSEGQDSGDKAANKLMSAAYKYALGQMLSIPFAGMEDQDATPSEPIMPLIKDPHASIATSATVLGVSRDKATAKWRAERGGLSLEEFDALPPEDVMPFAQTLAAFAAKGGR